MRAFRNRRCVHRLYGDFLNPECDSSHRFQNYERGGVTKPFKIFVSVTCEVDFSIILYKPRRFMHRLYGDLLNTQIDFGVEFKFIQNKKTNLLTNFKFANSSMLNCYESTYFLILRKLNKIQFLW